MSVVGLIFSNIHDKNIPELTQHRTMASVPFGGRYRLIDFILSAMVNAEIVKVGIITHNNYQSLIDHLSTGADWDLARRTDGLKLLTPFMLTVGNDAPKLYTTRLEALISVDYFLNRCEEDYVLLSDSDIVSNVDVRALVETHIQSGADVTTVYKPVYRQTAAHQTVLSLAKGDRVREILRNPNTHADGEKRNLNLNLWMIRRSLLCELVDEAREHARTDLLRDVISPNLKNLDVRAVAYDGYFASMNSLSEYFSSNMDLINPEARAALFEIPSRPVLTKIRNSTPTYYSAGCHVENCLCADGCRIGGTALQSVFFRGVSVGKDAVVKHSILMQDTEVGEGAVLENVITDKNVKIRAGTRLSGHATMPFYIRKGAQL